MDYIGRQFKLHKSEKISYFWVYQVGYRECNIQIYWSWVFQMIAVIQFCYNTTLAMVEPFDNEELNGILRESTQMLIKEQLMVYQISFTNLRQESRHFVVTKESLRSDPVSQQILQSYISKAELFESIIRLFASEVNDPFDSQTECQVMEDQQLSEISDLQDRVLPDVESSSSNSAEEEQEQEELQLHFRKVILDIPCLKYWWGDYPDEKEKRKTLQKVCRFFIGINAILPINLDELTIFIHIMDQLRRELYEIKLKNLMKALSQYRNRVVKKKKTKKIRKP